VEKPAFGTLEWESLPIRTAFSLLLGKFNMPWHNVTSLTYFSSARGAGQNGGATGAAASGETYLSTLEQAVVDFSRFDAS